MNLWWHTWHSLTKILLATISFFLQSVQHSYCAKQNAKMEQNKIKTLKNNNSMNNVFCFHRQWKNQRERSVMRNKTDGFIRWEWENCITLSLHFLISPVLSLCPQLYVHYYTVVNLIKFREEGDRLSLLASVWLANSKMLLNAESLEVKQTKQQQSQQSQTRTTYLVVLVSLVKKHCAHTHTHTQGPC